MNKAFSEVNLNSENYAVVWTRCDEKKKFDKEKGSRIFQKIVEDSGCKSDLIKSIGLDKHFLFRGEEGNDPATTTEELINWLEEINPKQQT